MMKKGISLFRSKNLKAQITIFIIVGIMILFIFISLFAFYGKIARQEQQNQLEDVFGKVFKKEALRIYVEDCLHDELEKGLVLLGKQGTIWSDQPGGRESFIEGMNGITVPETGERVFYGITEEAYNQYNNSFPCDEENNTPEFCRYSSPNTKVGFGEYKFRSSTVENDLKEYLSNKTVECITDFTRNNISRKAKLVPAELEINLDLLNEGINVDVTYPLKFTLQEEEFFHLSEFDFFFPTKFKQLLDSTITTPLRWDQKYVDFIYNDSTLKMSSFNYKSENDTFRGETSLCELGEEYFVCQRGLSSQDYENLLVDMTKKALDNGDDLFTFSSPFPNIVLIPGEFKMQIVRQNRPPALDYVGRNSCPLAGYDYLVIREDPGELGKVDVSLSAEDADEDQFNYNIDLQNAPTPTEVDKNNGKIVYDQNDLPVGEFSIKFKAVDEHSKEDWQETRFLVDRPVDTGISLNIPYKFYNGSGYVSYSELFDKDLYVVSPEDPVFINITFPEKSRASLSAEKVNLQYWDEKNPQEKILDYLLPDRGLISGTNGCFSFPYGISDQCQIDPFKGWFLSGGIFLQSEYDHFWQLTNDGRLKLSFSVNYCDEDLGINSSEEARIVVKECLPHRNPEHPFAYPFHNYVYNQENDEWSFDDDYNPLLATHSCCVGNVNYQGAERWRIAYGPDDPCFVNPDKGCYGRIEDYTILVNGKHGQPRGYDGYVWEKEERYCDGNYGSKCEGEFKYDLWNFGKTICGNYSGKGCSKEIDPKCANNPSFGLIENEGWCTGIMGCSIFCDKGVVYLGASTNNVFNTQYINSLAYEKRAIGQSELADFSCGCQYENGIDKEGNICDANYDGKFKGICESGKCCSDIDDKDNQDGC